MCKKYGYCRISTGKQDISRQERNILAAAPDAVIVKEEYTGRTVNRPKFEKLVAGLKKGDTVIFDSVSRMVRNASEGVSLYERLYKDGINLVFLNEPYVNTDVYRKTAEEAVPMTGTEVDCILSGVNQYLILLAKKQVQIAFEQAQKEVDDLSIRTKQGIETARIAGKKIGNQTGRQLTAGKEKPIKDIILSRSRDFAGTDSDSDVLTYLSGATVSFMRGKKTVTVSAKISRNTYYKYKAELKAEMA